MNAIPSNVSNSSAPKTSEHEIYKSRWGYHLYSKEHFDMLKALHAQVWHEYALLCAWGRLAKKHAQNRPKNKWISLNLAGHKTMFLRDASSVYDVASASFLHYRKLEDGTYGPYMVYSKKRDLDPFSGGHAFCMSFMASQIVRAFRHARTVYETEEDVREVEFVMRVEDIEDEMRELKKMQAGYPHKARTNV